MTRYHLSQGSMTGCLLAASLLAVGWSVWGWLQGRPPATEGTGSEDAAARLKNGGAEIRLVPPPLFYSSWTATTAALWSGPPSPLEEMTLQNWRKVLDAYDPMSIEPNSDRATEWRVALERAGSLAGKEAVEGLLKTDRAEGMSFARSAEAFAGWALAQPEAAWEWLAESKESSLRSALLPRFQSAQPEELVADVVANLAILAPDDKPAVAAGSALELIESAGYEAGDDFLDSLALSTLADPNSEIVLRGIFDVLAQQREQSVRNGGSLQDQCDWLASYADRAFAEPAYFASAAAHLASEQSPAAAADWLASITSHNVNEPGGIALRHNFQQWIGKDSVAARHWLTGLKSHPAYHLLAQDLAALGASSIEY